MTNYFLPRKGKDSDEQPQLTVDIGEPQTEALEETVDKGVDLVYSLNDRPPWYLCILLGFQVNQLSLIIIYCDSKCCRGHFGILPELNITAGIII